MIEEPVTDYEREEQRLRARVARLEQALRNLLLSADADWEARGLGHDWLPAARAARAALEETP